MDQGDEQEQNDVEHIRQSLESLNLSSPSEDKGPHPHRLRQVHSSEHMLSMEEGSEQSEGSNRVSDEWKTFDSPERRAHSAEPMVSPESTNRESRESKAFYPPEQRARSSGRSGPMVSPRKSRSRAYKPYPNQASINAMNFLRKREGKREISPLVDTGVEVREKSNSGVYSPPPPLSPLTDRIKKLRNSSGTDGDLKFICQEKTASPRRSTKCLKEPSIVRSDYFLRHRVSKEEGLITINVQGVIDTISKSRDHGPGSAYQFIKNYLRDIELIHVPINEYHEIKTKGFFSFMVSELINQGELMMGSLNQHQSAGTHWTAAEGTQIDAEIPGPSKATPLTPTSRYEVRGKAQERRPKMLLVNDGSGDPGPAHAAESYDYSSGETQWCFSQVKGALDDDVTEADIISCVEFNDDGDFLATGDKGGRVVIFQRDPISKNCIPRRGEYNVYSTFQSHEPEFDYLKSLEIEEKINKIRWLRRKNPAHFLLSTNDKTIKLWKVAEKEWKVEGFNLKEDSGSYRDPQTVTTLQVPAVKPSPLSVEASIRRVFANAHTYHINSISLNSDQETYLSADDLRINLWNLEINDQSFNIVDIKPTNMEELTEVITAAEFHPTSCNEFVYSSSKGTIRLCDMRKNALCDSHTKLFDEPEDPTNRSFFSEIISSISDVKFSYSGRYMVSRDYLTIKVWDLQMESRPVECYPVHEYLRSKLCSLYENDCIFDKFECCWNGTDSAIMTGSYNNFFRMFDRNVKKDYTLEASRDVAKPRTILKPRKVSMGGKRKKDEIGVDCLDFSKKILHTAWHPKENIIAVAATNNLFVFQDKY